MALGPQITSFSAARLEKDGEPNGWSTHGGARVGFDGGLKFEFHGSQVTSDAGLLPYRDLDDTLGLTTMVGGLLHDWRTGKNTQRSMTALLRQTFFSRLAGHENASSTPGEGRVADTGLVLGDQSCAGAEERAEEAEDQPHQVHRIASFGLLKVDRSRSARRRRNAQILVYQPRCSFREVHLA